MRSGSVKEVSRFRRTLGYSEKNRLLLCSTSMEGRYPSLPRTSYEMTDGARLQSAHMTQPKRLSLIPDSPGVHFSGAPRRIIHQALLWITLGMYMSLELHIP